jgi:hypothetical protein
MANSRILVPALLCILLASCEPRIPRAVVMDEPVRILNVLIVLEDRADLDRARKLIAEVNAVLISQTGLALWPMTHRTVDFPSRQRGEMLKRMFTATIDVREHFDLYIAFVRKTPWDRVKRVFLGDWLGVIDDTFRRYIVIKELDARVLAHEVYHAFLESEDHSGCGLMATLVEFLPGMPLNYSMELCERDRIEIMANRGRRFDHSPWPVKTSGADTLAIK